MRKPSMFRRETIIALRARHQAYRIATEILHPHVQTPRPPEPAIPMDLPDLTRFRRHATTVGMIALAAAVWAAVAVYWMVHWLTQGR